MNVFVLDGNENQAVASVRSLGKAGHQVWVGSDAPWSKAGWSRWASGSFQYPSSTQDANGCVAAIASEVARHGGGLVLPMTERTTLPLSANRSAISSVGGTFVLPSHETVLRAFDKGETTRLAESLGVATPATAELSSRADAVAYAERGIYPTVLKPRSSETVARNAVRAGGAPSYARNPDELLQAFDAMRNRSDAVLAQEYVEGSGAGYFALMRNGELVSDFAHRRIRDVRPTGSGSSVRESVLPDPRTKEAGVAVLRGLKWHGVAMVEFRMRADGTPVFLEVNGRFWNSLALAVFAGADFPNQLARLAQGEDPTPERPFRPGVRCRWLLGDARHLAAVLKGPPTGFTGRYPKRLRTLLDVLTPVPGTYHDNFTFDDPMPEAGDWIDFFARRVPSQLRRARADRAHADVAVSPRG